MNPLKVLTVVLALLFLAGSVFAAPQVRLIDPDGGETMSDDTYDVKFEVKHEDNLNMTAFIVLDEDDDMLNGIAEIVETSLDIDDTYCDSDDFTDWTECTYEMDLSDMDDGEYYLGIEVSDTENKDDLDYSDDAFLIDTQGPVFTNLFPKNKATTNKLNQIISCIVEDDGSGVEEDSIAMKVEGETFTLDDDQLSFKKSTGKITFNAGKVFKDNQVVNVTVEAEDKAGHLSQKSWKFTVDVDSDSTPSEDEPQGTVVDGENRQIFMSPAFTELTLEPGRNMDVPFTFTSSARENVCGKVTVESDYGMLYASMLSKNICLNKGETTQTALAVVANRRAELGSHKITVTMNVDGVKSEETIEVKIGYQNSIKVEFVDKQADIKVGRA